MLRWTPDEIQSRILRSKARNIIVLAHRQFGKSQTIAHATLHEVFYYSDKLDLVSSPTERQSKEMFRKIMGAARLLPDLQLVEDSKSYMTLANRSRVVTLSGTADTIRGYSAPDKVIVDEASRAPEDLYVALMPMLMMSQGQLILISTPAGKQGFFYDVWTHHGRYDPEDWQQIDDEWERYKITAYENPRIMDIPERKAWLEQERERLSDRMFRQEYLCEFVEAEDNVFSYDDIQRGKSDSVKPLFDIGPSSKVKPLDL